MHNHLQQSTTTSTNVSYSLSLNIFPALDVLKWNTPSVRKSNAESIYPWCARIACLCWHCRTSQNVSVCVGAHKYERHTFRNRCAHVKCVCFPLCNPHVRRMCSIYMQIKRTVPIGSFALYVGRYTTWDVPYWFRANRRRRPLVLRGQNKRRLRGWGNFVPVKWQWKCVNTYLHCCRYWVWFGWTDGRTNGHERHTTDEQTERRFELNKTFAVFVIIVESGIQVMENSDRV